MFVDPAFNNFKQYIITGNTVYHTQTNASYTATLNFIKSSADFIYCQIYYNTLLANYYSSFGAWLDAGSNLTTGTNIEKNTHN